MTEIDKSKDYYTTGQAADIIGFNAATIYRLCEKGKIPGAYKIGTWWRIRKVDFHDYIKAKGFKS